MSNNKDSSSNSLYTSENKSCKLSIEKKPDLFISENKSSDNKINDDGNVNQFSFNYKLDEFLIKNNLQGGKQISKSDDKKLS